MKRGFGYILTIYAVWILGMAKDPFAIVGLLLIMGIGALLIFFDNL